MIDLSLFPFQGKYNKNKIHNSYLSDRNEYGRFSHE